MVCYFARAQESLEMKTQCRPSSNAAQGARDHVPRRGLSSELGNEGVVSQFESNAHSAHSFPAASDRPALGYGGRAVLPLPGKIHKQVY